MALIERLRTIEPLARVRGTRFRPDRADYERALSQKRICIATKSRNLGDALALTTLPRKLKDRYPGLAVTTYTRGFNRVVFLNHPCVDATSLAPRAIFGDDCNAGQGQLIQLKERWFDLRISPEPRPEIHLSAQEKEWARQFLRLRTTEPRKPLVLLHPWGRTNAQVATVETWDRMVREHRDRFRFWQVGLYGHAAIQGCEYYLFSGPGPWEARKLFALMPHACRFIGVDSGPMHVARAFHVPSLILSDHEDPERAREIASRNPEAGENRRFVTLYPGNLHVSALTPERLLELAPGFLLSPAEQSPLE